MIEGRLGEERRRGFAQPSGVRPAAVDDIGCPDLAQGPEASSNLGDHPAGNDIGAQHASGLSLGEPGNKPAR